jgi:hypothetical protein
LIIALDKHSASRSPLAHFESLNLQHAKLLALMLIIDLSLLKSDLYGYVFAGLPLKKVGLMINYCLFEAFSVSQIQIPAGITVYD